MTTLNSSASCQHLTVPVDKDPYLDVPAITIPSLNLEIPVPIEVEYEDGILYAWDIEGFGIISKVFVGYNLWADNFTSYSDLEAMFEFRLDMIYDRLVSKNETIDILEKDRDRAYELFNRERADKTNFKRRNTIKLVVISGSTAVVGAAVGILIGFMAG